jgi:hypothetical protein
MAITAAIIGSSGSGKTTSTIIGPDGKYDPEKYEGMNPESHIIIHIDSKGLPFKGGKWSVENKNFIETEDLAQIKSVIAYAAKNEKIKSIALDTLNAYLTMKEFNERKKMTYDQWKDIANDVIELNHMCNTILRKDQIAYIFGHTMLQTQPNGDENIVFAVTGKKLTKVQPESFYPIVLLSRVEYGMDGKNKFMFQTRACKSSVKTPIGMFEEFEIPNSLSYVDKAIRDYYEM